MIKIADKDDDYVYMYSENQNEIYSIKDSFKVSLTTTYRGCPALIVKRKIKKRRI